MSTVTPMMNVMEWSECTQNVVTSSGGSTGGGAGNVPTNGGGAAAIGIDHHHHLHHHHPNVHHRDNHHHMNHLNHHHTNHQIVSAAPTIKNHSVTHFNGYLYCFGGYDGRRNHMTLLLYSIQQQRWIRPYHISTSNSTVLPNNNNNNNANATNTIPTSPSSVQSNSSSTVNSLQNDTNSITSDDTYRPPGISSTSTSNTNTATSNILNTSALSVSSSAAAAAFAAALANAGITGGTNSNNNDTSIIMQGTPPPGRNGHSATLATDPDDDEQGRIIIIGGWLGTGPLAASDMHVLDISHINENRNNRHRNRNSITNNNTTSSQAGGSISDGSRQLLRWYQPAVKGTPPGPCNMHSADYVMNRKEVYVFRGGNGREYLNDLHALHVDTLTWRKVTCTGTIPQQRANHSSAILDKPRGGGSELFIFGGWNGTERLNDIHILDTDTSTWTAPHVAGVLPHPRAGMTLTALRGRLYLFGGSGTSAKCFQDLQILDRQEMAWLDVVCDNEQGINANNSMNSTNTGNTNNNAIGANGSANLGGGVVGAQGMVNDNNRFRFGGSRMYGSNHALLDDAAINSTNGDIIEARPQQQGGTQDYASNPSYGRALNDPWRLTRDNNPSNAYMLHHQQQQYTSPNPNDEDTVPSVLVHGHGPGRRAGHTATAVNRKIYIFGGSCGSDYLNGFFVLDTDPPPSAAVTEPNPLLLMERRLRHFFNDPEFADVVFVVGEHKDKVYGHKMVLSIVSDCFRAMFTTGFKESDAMEIAIPDCSHAAFLSVMEYIYTGTLPLLLQYHHYNNNNQQAQQQQQHLDGNTIHSTNSCASTNAYMINSQNLLRIVEILEIADRFFLDHLKQVCEQILQTTVNSDTVEFLLSVAQKTNSIQLQSICQHYYRNNDTSLFRSSTTSNGNYPTPSPPISAGQLIIPSATASFHSTEDIVTQNNNNNTNNNDTNLDNSILSSSSSASSNDSTIETTNGNDAP